MRRDRETTAWFGFRTLLWAALVGLALGSLGPGALKAADPLGLDAASIEVRAALEDMVNALNAAPRQVQTTISADLHLMGRAIARALDRLEDEATAIADPTLAYDLNLLADVAHAATDELHALRAAGSAGLTAERERRLDRLNEAAIARLVEINLVIDGWQERSRNAVVELRDAGGAVVVRSTDRLIYNGVRYVSIALLMVGLLAVGLQLLRPGAPRAEGRAAPPRRGWLPSALAVAVLTVFFAGCVVLSVRPGTLTALSAEVRVQTQEHPCERLAAQRDLLIVAQGFESPGLIEATKQRMRPAAQDCLGLPSEAVTAEAIERLATKSALTGHDSGPGWRPAVALAATQPGPAEVGVVTLPEGAELAPAETQLRDGLAELLSSIRLTDPPPAPDPAESIEPAAGPSQSAALEPLPEPRPGPPAEPEPEPELFVTTTMVNYRDGPSVDARRLGTLVPGARLTVRGLDAGWAEVLLEDGRQAYVAREFLEPVP